MIFSHVHVTYITFNYNGDMFINFINIMLQTKTETTSEYYNQKRNKAKEITRKANNESWDKFIRDIESNIHDRQSMAY